MMAVSTRIRYGLRALIYLARDHEEQFIPLNFISEKEHISQKYLENIFTLLKRGKIVTAVRGPEGGYTLTKPPAELTVYEIVKALEGPIAPSKCVSDPHRCSNTGDCGTRDFWKEFQEHTEHFFKTKTLSEIVGQVHKRNGDGKKTCLYG